MTTTPETRRALIQTVHAVSTVASCRDPYTASHQERVAQLALAVGQRLDLDEHSLEGLYLGALVHDIGKVAIPGELLVKPGKLTPEEFALIRTHVAAGLRMFERVSLPWPVKAIIAQHHERLDGSGYPQGLAGAAIVLEARITAVADVFEAMCEPRPFRAAPGRAAAMAELRRGAGALYDTNVVDALASLVCDAGEQDIWQYIESQQLISTVVLDRRDIPL